jgi:hypothetical protein
MALTIEPDGSNDYGPCKCCGNMSRTVWGYIQRDGEMNAVYYVHWTRGRLDHGIRVELIVGKWDDASSADDRSVVELACRLHEGEPQFMIRDAEPKKDDLAAHALRRDQIVGTPMSKEVFEMVDVIWLRDDRIRELTGGSNDWKNSTN